MGSGYILVNHTKKEKIYFLHIPATKARELAGNPKAQQLQHGICSNIKVKQ